MIIQDSFFLNDSLDASRRALIYLQLISGLAMSEVHTERISKEFSNHVLAPSMTMTQPTQLVVPSV